VRPGILNVFPDACFFLSSLAGESRVAPVGRRLHVCFIRSFFVRNLRFDKMDGFSLRPLWSLPSFFEKLRPRVLPPVADPLRWTRRKKLQPCHYSTFDVRP